LKNAKISVQMKVKTFHLKSTVATPELKSLGCAWGQRWSMFFNSMTHDKPYHIAYHNIIFYSKYLLKNIYINFYNKYLLFIINISIL
jgi:hypothetical protein